MAAAGSTKPAGHSCTGKLWGLPRSWGSGLCPFLPQFRQPEPTTTLLLGAVSPSLWQKPEVCDPSDHPWPQVTSVTYKPSPLSASPLGVSHLCRVHSALAGSAGFLMAVSEDADKRGHNGLSPSVHHLPQLMQSISAQLCFAAAMHENLLLPAKSVDCTDLEQLSTALTTNHEAQVYPGCLLPSPSGAHFARRGCGQARLSQAGCVR